MKALVVYGTSEGMTARIADRMAQTARGLGYDVDVLDAARVPRSLSLEPYDAILVGGSVHMRGYQRSVRRFIVEQRHLLSIRRSAFFSVCLAIHSTNEGDRQEALRLADAFPAGLGWRPAAVHVFAGALMYTKYGFITRAIMRAIARREGGDLRTDRDHVYTDWQDVERFVRDFLAPPPAWRSTPAPQPASPSP